MKLKNFFVAGTLGVGLALSTSIPAQAVAPATILATYHDADGITLDYRQGTFNFSTNKGFGYAKISGYHGLYKRTSVIFAVHNPAGGTPVTVSGSNDRQYYAWANRGYRDSAGVVHYTDSVEVLVVARLDHITPYYGVALSSAPGIITAYCDGYKPVCPSWVDTALSGNGAVISSKAAPSESSSAGSAADDSEVLAATYKPLASAEARAAAIDASSDQVHDVDQAPDTDFGADE